MWDWNGDIKASSAKRVKVDSECRILESDEKGKVKNWHFCVQLLPLQLYEEICGDSFFEYFFIC